MLKPATALNDPVIALRGARALAFAVPAALLAGAYVSQYGFGLYPCEMCWWQRYAHFAALIPAALAFSAPAASSRAWTMTIVAAIAIGISGAIGLFHAGVEYGWWEGLTQCTGGATSLEDIMSMPLVRCDEAQWTLAGISLAGFNAIFSLAGAAVIAALIRKGRAR